MQSRGEILHAIRAIRVGIECIPKLLLNLVKDFFGNDTSFDRAILDKILQRRGMVQVNVPNAQNAPRQVEAAALPARAADVLLESDDFGLSVAHGRVVEVDGLACVSREKGLNVCAEISFDQAVHIPASRNANVSVHF